MVRPIHYLVTAAAILPSTALSAAQRPTATVSGRVVDRVSLAPIPGAQVALLGAHRQAASDSGGRFTQEGLAPGPYVLQIRALGYTASTWVIRLDTGQVLDRDFDLAPAAYTLAPITREATPGLMALRLRDFERRKAQGRGVFITEDDIQRTNAGTLSEVLRTVAGVQVVCNSAGCTARMTRAATGVCRPDFFVDGLSANFSTNANLPTVGIVAIEVYRSGGEAPVEFLRADTDCGVIVIWTRSAPNP
jgi:carboxypeptidase family protein/TonB-dependent receptor-like protein